MITVLPFDQRNRTSGKLSSRNKHGQKQTFSLQGCVGTLCLRRALRRPEARAVWGSSVEVCENPSGGPHLWQVPVQLKGLFNQGSMKAGPSKLSLSSIGFKSSCDPRVSQEVTYRDHAGQRHSIKSCSLSNFSYLSLSYRNYYN